MRLWRRIKYYLLVILSLGLCLISVPSFASLQPIFSPYATQTPDTRHLTPDTLLLASSDRLQQGQQLYEAGRLNEAVSVLQQAIQAAGNPLERAMASRNLALVYQQLNQWDAANQAIATSLMLLEQIDATERLPVQASILEVQGSLQFAQGQTEAAFSTWEQASAIYDELGDTTRALQSRINQAQALQRLGFYRRAIALLTPLAEALQQQPDSIIKAVGLRSLGNALQVVGDLTQARIVLQTSLEVAQRLQLPEAISAAYFSLGNTARAQNDTEAASNFYRQAAASAGLEIDRVRSQLNLFSLLIDLRQVDEAEALLRLLQPQVTTLPPSEAAIYARVNFVQSLMHWAGGDWRVSRATSTVISDAPSTGTRGTGNPELRGPVENLYLPQYATPTPVQPAQPLPPLPTTALPSPQEIAPILVTAIQQARTLGNARAESYAVGMLGKLYEQTRQWHDAEELTQQALLLAEDSNAKEIAYRWQWQMGRLFKAQADTETNPDRYNKAIAAYSEAIVILQSLRNDLVAINPEVQLSFQDSVEPIHRQLVSLLLTPGAGDTNPDNLEKARKVIESLQLAELDNFFRQACLDAQPVEIDQIDQQAAVLYPIILADRLEVILRLPNQPLRHFATPISQTQVETLALTLRQQLTNRARRLFLAYAQQLYDWLIRPVEADLAESGVETLVFVLDGVLRNLPMAVLHDGQHYLIETYSVALTPGLQLLAPKSLTQERLGIITAGLSEARQGFTALPNVVPELEQIQAELPSRILLNDQFTANALQAAIDASPEPIVHLATHGKFSSELEDTFILTWDGRIDINQLNALLQTSETSQSGPIELLVLSACQTATGDKLAALGLAGVAVRAGARSTLATLWSISDEATAILMSQFYAELNQSVTKAEALRRAQLKVLQVPRFRGHPYYWAPYVLIGNWL
jgi:CHAT domain-containing protein